MRKRRVSRMTRASDGWSSETRRMRSFAASAPKRKNCLASHPDPRRGRRPQPLARSSKTRDGEAYHRTLLLPSFASMIESTPEVTDAADAARDAGGDGVRL